MENMASLNVYPGPTSNLCEETQFAGRKLRELRRSRGLTQIQLADLLNVTQPMISRWESGLELAPRPCIPG